MSNNKGDKDMGLATETMPTATPAMKDYVGGADWGSVDLRKKIMGMDAWHEGHTPDKKKRGKNLVQVPLDYYGMRGWISEREFLAGTEFHKLWYYGAMKNGYAQMKFAESLKLPPLTDSHSVLADKYVRAKKVINGLVQALMCYNVCCLGEWATTLKPEDLNDEVVGKNRRMFLLRSGLTDLANHFRLPQYVSSSLKQGSDEKAESGVLRGHINLNSL
jgi:hypothetical protein